MRKPAKKMFTTRYRIRDIELLRQHARLHGISQVSILEDAIYQYYSAAPKESVNRLKVKRYTTWRKAGPARIMYVVSVRFKLAPETREMLQELKTFQRRPIEHIVQDAIGQYFKSMPRKWFWQRR